MLTILRLPICKIMNESYYHAALKGEHSDVLGTNIVNTLSFNRNKAGVNF